MKVLPRFLLSLVLMGLAACGEMPVKSGQRFQFSERAHLYQLKNWSFDGRLSVTDGQESWSAAIEWQHSEKKDEIKLSGPFGQGGALIILTDKLVVIDRGDDKITQSNQVDEYISQQLGMFVPVRALRYWVLGLAQPETAALELEDGFIQAKWTVHYLQMQQSGKEWLPRKMNLEQAQAKLKLVIDQWGDNETK